jgi:hypothetical protein
MTDPPADPATGRWLAARTELLIAAAAVAIAAAAGAAVAGWPGLVTVAVTTAVIAVLMLRAIIPRAAAMDFRTVQDKPQARGIYGYGHRVFVVATSLNSGAMYESDLRPVLEHVLAARLAENHSVNLYAEPEQARRAFCRTKADESLWPWIDPRQAPSEADGTRKPAGISRRTLARLITRLEQL